MAGTIRKMRRREYALAVLWLLPLASGAGCGVVYPASWPDDFESHAETIDAEVGVPYASVPSRWLWGRRRVVVERVRREVTRAPFLYRADLSFRVFFDGRRNEGVECFAGSEDGGGIAWLRCWSPNRKSDVVLSSQCAPRAFSRFDLGCFEAWPGSADQSYRLSQGRLGRGGVPVGYISWATENGEPALSASVVAERRISIHGPAGGAVLDRLVLLTVAVHQWWHLM